MSDENRHILITVQRVHTHPMSDGRAQPDRTPRKLFGSDARDTAKEVRHMVLAVPCRQRLQIVADRVEAGDIVRADILLDIHLRRPAATNARLHSMSRNGIHNLRRHSLPQRFLTIVGRHRSNLRFATQHIASEQVILMEERLNLKDRSLHPCHRLG